MLKYAEIIFLQSPSSDFDGTILQQKNRDIFKFLSQWDYGEYWNIKSTIGAGQSDQVVEDFWPYILVLNKKLGYAGLCRALNCSNSDDIIDYNPVKPGSCKNPCRQGITDKSNKYLENWT